MYNRCFCRLCSTLVKKGFAKPRGLATFNSFRPELAAMAYTGSLCISSFLTCHLCDDQCGMMATTCIITNISVKPGEIRHWNIFRRPTFFLFNIMESEISIHQKSSWMLQGTQSLAFLKLLKLPKPM